MKVNSLKLVNFRNYENSIIEFGEGINLIYGNNASGKTNLVEAISLISIGKSFRTNDDQLLIKKNEEFARIELEYFSKKNNQINLVISENGKNIEHNDYKLDRLSKLSGLLLTLTFIPDDVSMFKDAPSVRRKFLDVNLCNLFPNYLNALNEYKTFLKQRNSLLKEEEVNIDLLETLEERMYKPQYDVSNYRRTILKELESRVNLIFETLDKKGNKIKIRYISDFGVFKPYEEYKQEIKEKYRRERENDLRRKNSGFGIQRDDFEIELNGLNVGEYASQGQNRLIALSLKLALARFIKEEKKEDPIVILDDVFSELDENHRSRLIDELGNYEQVFITSTDDEKDYFVNKYQVENNLVIRRNWKC